MGKLYVLLLVLLLPPGTAQANNLAISNVRVGNNLGGTADILFDVQWDNSWRDGTNWDAAWVFVKYRAVGPKGAWSHATLGANRPQTPADAAWSDTGDGTGVLLYRAGTGSGTFTVTGGRVTWNAASNYEIKVFGTEMVYIPEGAFNLNATNQTALANEFQSVNPGAGALCLRSAASRRNDGQPRPRGGRITSSLPAAASTSRRSSLVTAPPARSFSLTAATARASRSAANSATASRRWARRSGSPAAPRECRRAGGRTS